MLEVTVDGAVERWSVVLGKTSGQGVLYSILGCELKGGVTAGGGVLQEILGCELYGWVAVEGEKGTLKGGEESGDGE